MGANNFVKCNNCGYAGTSKLKGSGWITFIGLCFLTIPGIMYMIWRRTGLGVCKACGSDAVAPAVTAKTPPDAVNHMPNSVGEVSAEPKHRPISRPQTECPKCLEMVIVGATKCKHCGEDIIAI